MLKKRQISKQYVKNKSKLCKQYPIGTFDAGKKTECDCMLIMIDILHIIYVFPIQVPLGEKGKPTKFDPYMTSY